MKYISDALFQEGEKTVGHASYFYWLWSYFYLNLLTSYFYFLSYAFAWAPHGYHCPELHPQPHRLPFDHGASQGPRRHTVELREVRSRFAIKQNDAPESPFSLKYLGREYGYPPALFGILESKPWFLGGPTCHRGRSGEVRPDQIFIPLGTNFTCVVELVLLWK